MSRRPWRFVFAVAAITSAGGAVAIFLYSQRLYRKRRRNRQAEEKEAESVVVRQERPFELPSRLNRQIQKDKRRQLKLPQLVRKSPMYDNIQMADPEGRLLASISLKKAQWYVRKRFAEWTTPNASIQLNFVPKTRSGEEYQKSTKDNVCVGCGSRDYHMRHYVVPYAYRTLLPKRFKSHLSHDVVILCPDCHLHCGHETQLRMNALESGRPHQCQHASHVDKYLHGIRSAALALLRWKHKLPSTKVDEYDHLVRSYLHIAEHEQELSAEQLQEAIDVEYRIPNPNYTPGPEYVVRSMENNDTVIERFIRDWRQHFLDTVQPRFLLMRLSAPCSLHQNWARLIRDGFSMASINLPKIVSNKTWTSLRRMQKPLPPCIQIFATVFWAQAD